MAYIGKIPATGAFQKCDALSASATADYTLQVGSTNVVPESVNHMIVSLNGVIQSPTTAFSVSGSTLSFASSLTSNDSIDFVILLGNVLDIGVCSDSTVTSAKLVYPLTTFSSTGIDDNASANSILIDSAGHVTKPLQPAVHAYSSSAQDNIAAGIVTINLDAEVYDVNADFNISNYTFTAPVTGKYMVCCNVSMTDIDTAYQWLYGTLLVSSNRNYYFNAIDPRIEISADGLRAFSGSTLVDMDASDTLIMKTRSSAHGAAQNNIVTDETWMTVHLVC